MSYITQEEQLREAELYAEMKDLRKLKRMTRIKEGIFEQRRFQLRALVLRNLKHITKMQLKALDEEYSLIGLDKQCWTDEEHFLHDLERKIELNSHDNHTRAQREKIVRSALGMERKEEHEIQLLLTLVKEYIFLLYNELKRIDGENLLDIKNMLASEGKKIDEIGKIVTLEEKEEKQVIHLE